VPALIFLLLFIIIFIIIIIIIRHRGPGSPRSSRTGIGASPVRPVALGGAQRGARLGSGSRALS
jgi:hypothetical protein